MPRLGHHESATCPTNHESTTVPVPSFAGFDTSDGEQRDMSKRLNEIGRYMESRDGNAGLASHFVDLAHTKTRPGWSDRSGAARIVCARRVQCVPDPRHLFLHELVSPLKILATVSQSSWMQCLHSRSCFHRHLTTARANLRVGTLSRRLPPSSSFSSPLWLQSAM